MGNKQFGWCFIGSGSIAHRVLADMQYTEGSYVASVYSRNAQHAQTFAQKAGAAAYSSLEEAIDTPGVQAVYVATTNDLHYEHTLAALKRGKPVLCEKPFALSKKQAQAMVQTARENNAYLMEGMWTRFNPVIQSVLDWIAQGRIGNLLCMKAEYAARVPKSAYRIYDRAKGGGGLLDIGIYTLALAQFIFGKKPDIVQAMADFTPEGVDSQCQMTFQYAGGKMARLFSAITLQGDNNAVLYGDKGTITLERFALPDVATLHTEAGQETVNAHKKGEGFQYELDAVMRDVLAGRLENELVSHQYTLDVMETLDVVKREIGLSFPGEEDA